MRELRTLCEIVADAQDALVCDESAPRLTSETPRSQVLFQIRADCLSGALKNYGV